MPIETDNFESFMLGVKEDAAKALNAAAIEAERYARVSMRRMPSRKTFYRVLESGKKTRAKRRQTDVFTPAPAGGFPGVRTSNLRNSMTTGTATADALVSSFGVYSNSRRESGQPLGPHRVVKVSGTKGYAGHLQFGTSRMKARPWATLTIDGAKGQMASRFVAEFERGRGARR